MNKEEQIRLEVSQIRAMTTEMYQKFLGEEPFDQHYVSSLLYSIHVACDAILKLSEDKMLWN